MPPTSLIIGDINADLTIELPFYPHEGDDSTAQSMHWGSGGTGLNMASAFAFLGGHAILLGRVGNDPSTEIALRTAHAFNVDLSYLQHDPTTPTGLCTTTVTPGGERTFFAYRGANTQLTSHTITADFITSVDMLIISAYALIQPPQQSTTLTAIEFAQQHHIPIALDLALPPIRYVPNLIKTLLPTLALLLMNQHELAMLYPHESPHEAITRIQHQHVNTIVLKRGAQGCYISTPTEQKDIPAPSVKAIDTTGCGDAFTAAFTWGMIQGLPLETCATYANTLGALTATRRGAAEALPSWEEFQIAIHQ